ncbi:ABC-2 family transporter protein [Anaerocolumna sp.]|uniref:ABC-2 family transporter protein n=1 Tax=Anaerocolumna sp. TaxID=2041569 RepID=UPI0028A718E2|nr:ABC-2 family transporter protein [Anaerocolumna sp.]
MFWMKSRELNKILLKFKLSRYKMFKIDTILNLLNSFTYLLANLLFWYLITDTGFFIKEWTYSNILVFIAFSELFFGLDSSLFYMVSRFWRMIYSGALDSQLTRPLDPRLRFILLNINYIGALNSFITFIIILIVSQSNLNISLIFVGAIIVIISNIILALIRFVLSYTAFWLGKMDAISELADCLTGFNKYPMIIMPKTIKILFKTLLPFYFFSTFSAEIVIQKIDFTTFIYGAMGILCNLIFWSIINSIVWKKGTARYESLNG